MPLEHGVQALDGGDADAGGRVEVCCEVRCWTLYTSVNLQLLSGETYCWNSLSVCRPRLPRSTRNSTRLRAGELDQPVDED